MFHTTTINKGMLRVCGPKELTEEQEIAVNKALNPSPPNETLVEGFRLQLTRKDISTLAGLNWLNDEVGWGTKARNIRQ